MKEFVGKELIGEVVSVNVGRVEDELAKRPCDAVQAELDGLVGDRHRSFERENWKGDKQAEGIIRRNERQWSATSAEEMADIETKMDLKEPLTTGNLSVNLCFKGIPELSLLPKGTILKFPSGAELMVEEYNPPCIDMGKKLASIYTTHSGEHLADDAFSQAAKFSRGLVGVVEVAGKICVGDQVTVLPYKLPLWISRRLAQ